MQWQTHALRASIAGVCDAPIADTGDRRLHDSSVDVRSSDAASGTPGIEAAEDRVDSGLCRDTCSGTCASGGCVITLASNQRDPASSFAGFISSLSVDATSVYWADPGTLGTNDGRLVRVAIGGGLLTTLASGLDYPGAMAVDARSIYSNGDSNALIKVPLTGGSPVTLSSPGRGGLAVDGTRVYWARSCPDETCASAVTSVPLDGGVSTTLAAGGFDPFGVVVDATDVYWTTGGIDPITLHDTPAPSTRSRRVAERPPCSPMGCSMKYSSRSTPQVCTGRVRATVRW